MPPASALWLSFTLIIGDGIVAKYPQPIAQCPFSVSRWQKLSKWKWKQPFEAAGRTVMSVTSASGDALGLGMSNWKTLVLQCWQIQTETETETEPNWVELNLTELSSVGCKLPNSNRNWQHTYSYKHSSAGTHTHTQTLSAHSYQTHETIRQFNKCNWICFVELQRH